MRRSLPGLAGRRPSGFTLVELLVVVAIIALLVGILMPSLSRAKIITQRVLCAGNLHSVHQAVSMYASANDDAYPCATDPVSTSPFYWLWMGRGWRGAVQPYMDGPVTEESPSILFCQADPASASKYEATSYSYSLAFYHSVEQINGMSRTADTYSNPRPSVPQHVGDVSDPGRKIMIGEWTSNHERVVGDGGWWCWEGSRNFLFADGRVGFVAAEDINEARDGFPDANLTVDGVGGRDVP